MQSSRTTLTALDDSDDSSGQGFRDLALANTDFLGIPFSIKSRPLDLDCLAIVVIGGESRFPFLMRSAELSPTRDYGDGECS